MTAKKEEYSGPLLASDMSAGGEGARSAGRGGAEDRLDEREGGERRAGGEQGTNDLTAAKAIGPSAAAL